MPHEEARTTSQLRLPAWHFGQPGNFPRELVRSLKLAHRPPPLQKENSCSAAERAPQGARPSPLIAEAVVNHPNCRTLRLDDYLDRRVRLTSAGNGTTQAKFVRAAITAATEKAAAENPLLSLVYAYLRDEADRD